MHKNNIIRFRLRLPRAQVSLTPETKVQCWGKFTVQSTVSVLSFAMKINEINKPRSAFILQRLAGVSNLISEKNVSASKANTLYYLRMFARKFSSR